ncbi:hypothetical protein Lal_00026843 [Lupinus albus]|nr:hypothetical protein Lal_00026843 [Lupinus albus]
MSLSRPFDFIKDLNDSKHIWKIAVRITQIWYVQIPLKPGHLEMILMDSKEITCVTIGTTTMFVVGRQRWYYDGCTKCTKKTDVKDGPFTCKCIHFNQNSPRYKLDIKVNHEHSCGRFVFWDRQCADIIGISSFELKNQMLAEGEDDPNAFPLVLDELLARTMVLRVKIQPSYNQSSIIRLSEDPNLIKKVLDQIEVFEVFFENLIFMT